MGDWKPPESEMHECQRCGRMKWIGGPCECATPEEIEETRTFILGAQKNTERRANTMPLDKPGLGGQPRISSGPIETELRKSFDELTDKMLVATFNTARKKRLKMNVNSEIVDAELRVAGDLVDGRADTYVSGDGWAVLVEDEQQSLFATPISGS